MALFWIQQPLADSQLLYNTLMALQITHIPCLSWGHFLWLKKHSTKCSMQSHPGNTPGGGYAAYTSMIWIHCMFDEIHDGQQQTIREESVTIPEVRRYRSYEEPDETPNRGARFGSWLPHVMWYFVSQQRGCKWVFVWTLQRSMKFQTPRWRNLHQQAQTNGVVRCSTMGVRAHETPNQGAQFGKCWHWPALLPLQLASLYSTIANSK